MVIDKNHRLKITVLTYKPLVLTYTHLKNEKKGKKEQKKKSKKQKRPDDGRSIFQNVA